MPGPLVLERPELLAHALPVGKTREKSLTSWSQSLGGITWTQTGKRELGFCASSKLCTTLPATPSSLVQRPPAEAPASQEGLRTSRSSSSRPACTLLPSHFPGVREGCKVFGSLGDSHLALLPRPPPPRRDGGEPEQPEWSLWGGTGREAGSGPGESGGGSQEDLPHLPTQGPRAPPSLSGKGWGPERPQASPRGAAGGGAAPGTKAHRGVPASSIPRGRGRPPPHSAPPSPPLFPPGGPAGTQPAA